MTRSAGSMWAWVRNVVLALALTQAPGLQHAHATQAAGHQHHMTADAPCPEHGDPGSETNKAAHPCICMAVQTHTCCALLPGVAVAAATMHELRFPLPAGQLLSGRALLPDPPPPRG